MVDAGIPNLL